MIVFPRRLDIIVEFSPRRRIEVDDPFLGLPPLIVRIEWTLEHTSTAQVKKLLSGDYLTFYIGNLSYRANDVTLKTAIESRFPIKVDQAVVAYSSDGRSRGCAFATVRWKEYLDSHADSKSQSLVQKLRHRMTGKPLFGRPVFVELDCNQRRGG